MFQPKPTEKSNRDSIVQIREKYVLQIYWPAATPINPENECLDNVILNFDGKEYSTVFITPQFLKWLFHKNKCTGECATGTYWGTEGMQVVTRLDLDVIGNVLDKLLQEFGLDSLVAWKILDAHKKKPEHEIPYEIFVEQYKKRFNGYKLEICYPQDFDPANGRARVQLMTKDGNCFASNFVSFGYLNQSLASHQKEKRESVDKTCKEFFSATAVSIPYMVVLEYINQPNIQRTVDELIDSLVIESHFRHLLI